MCWNWLQTKDLEPEPISEPKPIIKVKSKKELEKEQLIKHLIECPRDLFKPPYTYVYYRYFEEVEEDMTLLEVAIAKEILSESDLCELDSQVVLDWFKISEIISLSQKTVAAHFYEVNWNAISFRFMHTRNFDFILTFSKYISWENVQKVNLYDNQIEFLVFVEEVIPLEFALRKNMLTASHIQNHIDRIIVEAFPEFCKSYKAEFLDSIPYSAAYEEAICNHADAYMNRCLRDTYVPKTYVKPLIEYTSLRSGDWCSFLIACQPDEAFVRDHIVSRHVTNETWAVLSGKETEVLGK